MSKAAAIGVLGGSFDPVHLAHIRLAWHVVGCLGLSEMRMLPCRLQPLKGHLNASAEQRVAMLQLAIADSLEEQPNRGGQLQVDDRELQREGPSFTADTVEQLRAELGEQVAIHFVIGWDSWLSFHRWHRWRDILQHVNVVILKRPGFEQAVAPELQACWQQHSIDAQQLASALSGKVCLLQSDEYEIASRDIRAQLSTREITSQEAMHVGLSPSVARYIAQSGLYMA